MKAETEVLLKRILIAEDDEGLRDLIARRLAKAGYEAVVAADGAETLDRIAAEIPDVLLLDQSLPDITGCQVLDVLAKRNGSVPFIVMTGQGDERLAVEMMKLGASDYLIKDSEFLDILPMAVARLFKTIETAQALREAEDDLRASERRFKELIRNSSDSVTILDENGMQLYVSDVVEKMLGYKPIELINVPVIEKMIHPEDKARVDEAFQTIIREGSGMVQYRHRHKNGDWVHLEAWGTNQLDNPDIRGVVVNVRDITERVLATEEREKLNNHISQMQKLESLGLLAGGIAHDFNNLMGGIFGYIDLAICEAEKSRVSEYLSKAMATMDRARALTRQLLTFAKGGTPAKQIDNLFPFVQETAQFALSGANVSCRFNVPKELWACSFDKNQIGQVIDNLVINAQQSMPMGGTVELAARNCTLSEKEHPLLASGAYVKIVVRDEGVGMPKELIEKIFDPFFTTKEKGHGLGLATCHSIINQHGGCIDVESEQGKGSTFSVYLPAVTEIVFTESKEASEKHRGCGTVLVMDDEEVIRSVVTAMLEALGYSVVCKENGQEVVEFFKTEIHANQMVDGMIFDLTVPGGMGGVEAVTEIRKLNREIPVFVSSGYADDPIMINPTAYGFTASICKPFKLAELSGLLNRYMK